ncbi:MAG: WD40 repeat domain-containing protein, partial [Acidobacteria bacterium]|nr:WD40 repeat domain-containing protein [Acidobacteriota bacterium]
QRLLEGGDKLLLVGDRNMQIIDLPNTRVVETRPALLPPEGSRTWYATDEWELAPDGRRILVFGATGETDAKRKLAWVWDFRAGRALAALDRSPSDIRSGVWSEDGSTIVTSSRHFKYINSYEGDDADHVFSFWDGETYELRGSVALENVLWWHLSDDGRRFFAATGRTKRSVVGVKYVSDSGGRIRAWDTRTGREEGTIASGDENFNPRTRDIQVSPDGRFLVFVNKHKSNPAEHRLLAWELNGSLQPLYEIKPSPKIDNSSVVFSPDSRLFAVDVGKNLQIYDTRTGEKRYELENVELPHAWLSDDVIFDVHEKRIVGRDKSDPAQVVDVKSGNILYTRRLTFRESKESNSSGGEDEDVLIYETVLPHPAGRFYATYDYEYVRVFDTRTGGLLQTVISPPVKRDKAGNVVLDKDGKPKLSHGAALKQAGWSRDGRTLYVFSANGQSVSVYGVVGN